MNIENLVSTGTIVFGVLGSYGLFRQAWLIWTSKSAASVSGAWVISSLMLYITFLIYGHQQDSLPMEIQGWMRIAFSLPITLGFFLYGIIKARHWAILISHTIVISCMYFSWLSPYIFAGLSYIGVYVAFVQAYTIWKCRSRGKVSIELQIIFFLASVFWFWYAIIRGDNALMATSLGFGLAGLAVIAMWFHYPCPQTAKPENNSD